MTWRGDAGWRGASSGGGTASVICKAYTEKGMQMKPYVASAACAAVIMLASGSFIRAQDRFFFHSSKPLKVVAARGWRYRFHDTSTTSLIPAVRTAFSVVSIAAHLACASADK